MFQRLPQKCFFIAMMCFLLVGNVFSLTLSSSVFAPNQPIPIRYTCYEKGISPPIFWKDVPAATQTFALIVTDPDAARPGGVVHWILFNIAKHIHRLEESTSLPSGATSGMNTRQQPGYLPFCPPKGSGTHRYYFVLYALNTRINIAEGVDKTNLLKAMQGHVITTAELMGTIKSPD